MIFLVEKEVNGLVANATYQDEAVLLEGLPSHLDGGKDVVGDYLSGITGKKKSKKILEETSEEFDDEIRSIDPSLKEYIQTMENMDAVVYPTNFVSFNILTGRNVRTETDELLYRVRGIREACIMLIAGNQSVGKSTFSYNVAASVKYHADTCAKAAGIPYRTEIHALAPEMGMEVTSIMRNCGLDETNLSNGEFFQPEGYKITTEYLADYVKAIHKRKMENKDKYTITGVTASNKKKKHLIPTILILDSWSILTPAALKEFDKNNNMYDAQKIKENNKILTMIFPLLKEANIMLFTVMQTAGKIVTNQYDMKPADYQALKEDTKLTGGKVIQYLADMVVYFNKLTDKATGSSSRKSVKEIIGIDDDNIGHAVQCIFVKNRFGDSSLRSAFHLVFDASTGFNPKYSFLYEVLKNEKILKTSGGRRTLDGYTKSFYSKEVSNLVDTDPQFVKCLFDRFESSYSWLLEAGNQAKKKFEEANNFMSNFLLM